LLEADGDSRPPAGLVWVPYDLFPPVEGRDRQDSLGRLGPPRLRFGVTEERLAQAVLNRENFADCSSDGNEADKMKRLLIFLLFFWAVQSPAQTVVQEFFAVSSMPQPNSDMDLPKATLKGSVLIAMAGPVTPGVKVESITDDAPAGGNTYKQVPGAASSCGGRILDIWYCENCNGGVTELKFHLSGGARMSINAFIEVSNMRQSSVLDGSGAHVDDGTRTRDGLEVGPSITTTATDFVVARYSSAKPLPTGVTPSQWTYATTYVYARDGKAGTYQPTLAGKGDGGSYCMSMAAFKTAEHPVGHK